MKMQQENRKWFVVMNSNAEYYCGLVYGGQPVWCNDYKEAKPLDNERKFKTLQAMCWGSELELYYL